MGLFKKQNIDELINSLGYEDYKKNIKAVKALGKLKDQKVVNALIATLGDDDRGFYAARALAKIGNQTVEPLIAALRDNNEYVQIYAAGALGEIGDKKAVEPLIENIKNKDFLVKRSAIDALTNIKDERAVNPLIILLESRSERVRNIAAEALKKIGGKKAMETVNIYNKRLEKKEKRLEKKLDQEKKSQTEKSGICPECNAVLGLLIRQGKVKTVCPRCGWNK